MRLRWCVCVLLVVAGCGETKSAKMDIGPSGGEVSAGDSASVDIPAGALTSTTPITVTSTSASSPTDTVAVGDAFLFGPEGTQFAQPVTVTLAFSSDLLPAGTSSADVIIYTAPAGSTSYQPLETTISDSGHVQAQTTHFSIFVAAVANHGNPHDMAVNGSSDQSANLDGGGTDSATVADQGPTSDGGCSIVFSGSMSGGCMFTSTCGGHTYVANCQVNACSCTIDGTSHGAINLINACSTNGQQLWTGCGFP